MRLLLIRHGLPERDDAEDGTTADPGLSPDGARQVEALVAALAGEQIDAVWSSPLRRAVQTGEPLARSRGLEVRTHRGLVEFDFGHQAYIPAEERSHPLVQQMRQRIADQSGDAELLAFRERVRGAVDEVVTTAEPDQTVAITCHGGVVNAYASSVLGTDHVILAGVAYTGFTIVTVSRSGATRLVSLNEHQHLRTPQLR